MATRNALFHRVIDRPATPSAFLVLPTFSAAVAQVLAGTGDARIAFIGDSTTVGAGTTNTGTKNPVARFAARYTTATTSYGACWGTGGSTPDTRVTLGTGWARGSLSGLSGGGFKGLSTASGDLQFTPAGSFDTIKVWYIRQSSAGSFNVNVDGGSSLGTVNANGANALLSSTFTCAAGTHTVHCTPPSADTFVVGIETYTAATKVVKCWNFGLVGAGAADFQDSGSPWNTLNTLTTIAPHLVVINLTINDIKDNIITAATYTTRLTTIYNSVSAYADVVTVVGNRADPATFTADTDVRYGQFKDAVNAVKAAALVIPDRWGGTYATANALSYMNADGIHPNDTGSNDIASALLSLIP